MVNDFATCVDAVGVNTDILDGDGLRDARFDEEVEVSVRVHSVVNRPNDDGVVPTIVTEIM